MNEPELYEIRVQGVLGESWETWFEGVSVRPCADATILSGNLDQSALHGILTKIGGLGLKLCSVRKMEDEE